MLILTRRIGETVIIGDEGKISFTIIGIEGCQVRIGINAPKEIPVHRQEVAIRIINEKLKKASEYNPNSEKSFNY